MDILLLILFGIYFLLIIKILFRDSKYINTETKKYDMKQVLRIIAFKTAIYTILTVGAVLLCTYIGKVPDQVITYAVR